MHLSKHHVFGNDFLVCLDAGESGNEACPPGWVRALCDRTRGVGADGVLWVRVEDDEGAGGRLTTAPLRGAMTLYNADGGEAEVSGNGLACLAQALTLRAGRDGAEVLIATTAGERKVVIENSRFADADDTGESFGRIRSRARVGLGEAAGDDELSRRAGAVLSDAAPAPVRTGYVSIGNPHVVALMDDEADLAALPLEVLGAAMQQRFGPVNFEAVAIQSPSRVRMRVWERGVGVTSACGSGAAATVWQLHRWGLVSPAVEVAMPGGRAKVVAGASVELQVPVTYVADVAAPEPATPTAGGAAS